MRFSARRRPGIGENEAAQIFRRGLKQAAGTELVGEDVEPWVGEPADGLDGRSEAFAAGAKLPVDQLREAARVGDSPLFPTH